MRTYRSRCWTLVLTLGLAACAWQEAAPPAGQQLAGTSLTLPAGSHKGYKLVYSFPGGAGGADPLGGLAFVDGVTFGTTATGGDTSGCDCGTVFAGTKAIYDFKGVSSKDGADPLGNLLPVGNELYGVTNQGGRDDGICASNYYGHGCGTVYEIDKGGNERVIYRFKGGTDGEGPVGGLVYRKGVLYGVTKFGGSTSAACETSGLVPGCGVVFAVDLSGHERVIYRFKGGLDGQWPVPKLRSFNGTMYGATTHGGGARFCAGGCGTVFSVTPSGSESVIYAFKGKKDGMTPASPLVAVNGFLYGTTFLGGCLRACGGSIPGGGTVFKVSLSGSETIVHRFIIAPTNGTGPEGPLVFLNGQLFGTTAATAKNGGTIYSATSKSFKYLYHFPVGQGGPDGLTLKPSTQEMYGVARNGGVNRVGSIFSYSL